jgi:hypothetical protein
LCVSRTDAPSEEDGLIVKRTLPDALNRSRSIGEALGVDYLQLRRVVSKEFYRGIDTQTR